MNAHVTAIFTLFGVLLVGCGTTANEDYCKLPTDCAANQDCVGNLCQDKAVVDGGEIEDIDAATLLPVAAAEPTLETLPIKTFRFTWTDVSDATYYKLLENPDGASEFVQVGDDIAGGLGSYDLIVPLYARVNAKYLLQTCNGAGCVDSAAVEVTGTLAEAIGYVKASNTGADDRFGEAVAISGDGKTIAVGAAREQSDGNGAGADQNNNSADHAATSHPLLNFR